VSARSKAILAYSGGLDTSVAVKWIGEKYNMDVITLTADLGQGKDMSLVERKALATGALKAQVVDARRTFVECFVFPALMAGAVYEGAYPLATALGRPLIAKLLVDAARENGATAVAHGCTGKGNDQVRIEMTVNTLAGDLDIIAPVREWHWTREQEIEYAEEHGIPVDVTRESPYSTDENLWGRSIEAGALEDPGTAPPEDCFEWTVSPERAPDSPTEIEIEFERGRPVAVDGDRLDGASLVARLNKVAGANGVGRIDHVENRLVGIKSREIYEAPAAVVLHEAHRALEGLCLSKDSARFKQHVAQAYADIIYNGRWFSAFHQDLLAFVASTQRFVTGLVRVRLYKGTVAAVGRKSPYSLYRKELATYDAEDQFDHSAAVGFIRLFGLDQHVQARTQLLESDTAPEIPSIIPPRKDLGGEA